MLIVILVPFGNFEMRSLRPWVSIRQVVDYVCTQVNEADLSIWEVRGKKKNFLYSKVMMW